MATTTKNAQTPPKRKPAAARSGPTPAMRQYHEQKALVGEAVLLFRMGDFYETFYDDAKTISRVLGLTLTTRSKDAGNPIPLAGVPYHAVDGYVAKLVRAGYKVAISEQMEDARQAKGVVRREVQRIITPGTLTDDALLDERAANCLVALCSAGEKRRPERRGSESLVSGPRSRWVGLACVELASGRFFAQMLPVEKLIDELARLRPAEMLVPEVDVGVESSLPDEIRQSLEVPIATRPPHVFDPHLAEQALCRHFRVRDVTGFGFDGFDASLCAAAAVLDYLGETQRAALGHILKIVPRRIDDCVGIDQVTLRALEVERTIRDGTRDGSLLDAVDRTVNPMGARRLSEWLRFPLRDAGAIVRRQDVVASLRGQPERLGRLRTMLRDMVDMERVNARLGVGRASPRDLVALGRTLRGCEQLADILGPPVSGDGGDLLSGLIEQTRGLESLAELLSTAFKPDAPPVVRDGGFIADGYNAELDRLRGIGHDGNRWLAEFQAREAERTGISKLKVGYNSVFGYYIEITHANHDRVPDEYVRRQTIRNAERYITDELKHFEREMLGAADRAKALEIELFEGLRAKAAEDLPRLQAAAEAVAALDALAGLAELSRERGYCRPELAGTDSAESPMLDAGGAGPGGVLEIADGRHPVLERTLAERFVPNDCALLPDRDRLLVITGPNMAGKSTYIRQVALLVLLAQAGGDVPARSMRWSPVDRIFARVGASDELARGHSTFMVEMVETARILNNATQDSLVILDEIGRGTSTYDGLAIAWAVTEYIAEHLGCRGLFATHYHELTELAEQLPGVANWNVAVREQLRPDGMGRDVVFLHRIVPGATDRSYGVHVAAMAGLPGSVVKRSETVLAELENSFIRKSHDRALAAGRKAHDDQPLLFSDPEPLPDWWRELVDAVAAAEVDRTTPVEALTLLQRLQGIIRSRPSGADGGFGGKNA
ncbi:MAG: DNA mismatch repair protein MutS [Phycisphaerae bacterium]